MNNYLQFTQTGTPRYTCSRVKKIRFINILAYSAPLGLFIFRLSVILLLIPHGDGLLDTNSEFVWMCEVFYSVQTTKGFPIWRNSGNMICACESHSCTQFLLISDVYSVCPDKGHSDGLIASSFHCSTSCEQPLEMCLLVITNLYLLT